MRTSRSPICAAPSAFPFSNNLQPSRTMNPRHLLPPLLAAALLVAYVAVLKYMAEKPVDVTQTDALERAQGRAAEALIEGGRS